MNGLTRGSHDYASLLLLAIVIISALLHSFSYACRFIVYDFITVIIFR